MLADRYKDDQKSILQLSESQKIAINSLETKIKIGSYRFEEVACSCCGVDDFEVLAEKDRYGLSCRNVICKNCGLVMINPRMDAASYAKFYANEYRHIYVWDYVAKVDFESYFNTRYEGGRALYGYLKEQQIIGEQPISILDIGCGSGGLLKYFDDQGHQTKGIDLGEDYTTFGKEKKGLDLEVNDIFGYQAKQPVDLIIYSHVFEHIIDLDRELGRISELLADDGYLFIAVPGVKWLRDGYLGDFLRYTQNAHTYSFSLGTLKNILQKNGFELHDGDEQVRAIFRRKTNATELPMKNGYSAIVTYLKQSERFRFFYKYKTKFRWTLQRIFGKK